MRFISVLKDVVAVAAPLWGVLKDLAMMAATLLVCSCCVVFLCSDPAKDRRGGPAACCEHQGCRCKDCGCCPACPGR